MAGTILSCQFDVMNTWKEDGPFIDRPESYGLLKSMGHMVGGLVSIKHGF